MREKRGSILAEQELEADFWGDVQVASPKKKKKKRSRPAVHVFLLLLVLFTAFGYLGYQLSDSWLSEGLSIARAEETAVRIYPVLRLALKTQKSLPCSLWA